MISPALNTNISTSPKAVALDSEALAILKENAKAETLFPFGGLVNESKHVPITYTRGRRNVKYSMPMYIGALFIDVYNPDKMVVRFHGKDQMYDLVVTKDGAISRRAYPTPPLSGKQAAERYSPASADDKKKVLTLVTGLRTGAFKPLAEQIDLNKVGYIESSLVKPRRVIPISRPRYRSPSKRSFR